MDDIQVKDLTHCCETATPRKSRLQSLVWIHRIGTTCGRSVPQIARFFIEGEGARATGGNMAYHYVVLPDCVQQALPLDEQGAHARRWGNAHGIGVAILGDFNYDRPTQQQWTMAASLTADLVGLLRGHSYEVWDLLPSHLRRGIPVVGHGEVPGTFSPSAGKEQPGGRYACPGRHWDMRTFRADVERELLRRAVVRCDRLGHSLTREGGVRAPASDGRRS